MGGLGDVLEHVESAAAAAHNMQDWKDQAVTFLMPNASGNFLGSCGKPYRWSVLVDYHNCISEKFTLDVLAY